MKIAVTSEGTDLDAIIDPWLGRAEYILIVDTESLEFEVIDTLKNKDTFNGAGIQVSALICEKGAKALLTGFCGPNEFQTLSAEGIKVAGGIHGRVIDAVKAFACGNLTFSEKPNAEAHWG